MQLYIFGWGKEKMKQKDDENIFEKRNQGLQLYKFGWKNEGGKKNTKRETENREHKHDEENKKTKRKGKTEEKKTSRLAIVCILRHRFLF